MAVGFCTAVYISEKQLLVLNFRGLSFEFRIDPKLEVGDKPSEFVLLWKYNLSAVFVRLARTSLTCFACPGAWWLSLKSMLQVMGLAYETELCVVKISS